ncbi:MAG: RNA-binding protein [Bacillota bacterium]|jgi:large subunit ribosomal protein L14e|nr:RNA-binding protein [Bacillota bacterium]HHU43037.1 RNA-binding protein [Clostridiales bacterium]
MREEKLLKPIELGSVVFSRAGRDAGRFFIVIEIVDDNYVMIADGDIRRLSKPKKKKIKHLKATGDINQKIKEKLLEKKIIYDAEIYSIIRRYNSQ